MGTQVMMCSWSVLNSRGGGRSEGYHMLMVLVSRMAEHI